MYVYIYIHVYVAIFIYMCICIYSHRCGLFTVEPTMIFIVVALQRTMSLYQALLDTCY